MKWETVQIGTVTKIVSGSTPKSGNPAFWGGSISWATPTDLSSLETKELSATGRQITKEGYESCSANMLPARSVLFSSRAPIGLVAINKEPVCTNQGFKSFVPDNARLSSDFLYWWLKCNRASLEHLGRGATFKEVSKSIIETVEIPLPPLDEQKRIAAILDAADALRAKRRQSIAQLDALIQSTFLDLFGDPVTNPMGWPMVEFEKIVESTKLGMVRGSTEFDWKMPVPYVRMDAITNDGQFLPEKVQGTFASEEEIEAYSLRAGDFLLNTRNSKELVGKITVFRGPKGWTFNNNIIRIRFFENVEPDAIAVQFRFSRVQQALENRKAGTTSVFAIYWKDLKTMGFDCARG
jgi:type I restriction enzyme S subunit